MFGILMIVLLQRTRDGVWPWLARAFAGKKSSIRRARPRAAIRATTPQRLIRALVVDRARKEFGGLVAVNDLSFDLRPAKFWA